MTGRIEPREGERYVGRFIDVYRGATVEFLRSRHRYDTADEVARLSRLRWPMYLAVSNGAVVAYLEGRFDEAYIDPAWAPLTNTARGAWIFELETDPSHRRQGWARRLVGAFVLDAQDAGSDYVVLTIDPRGDQTVRRAFFRALGFEPLKDDEAPFVQGAPIQTVLRESEQVLGGSDF